MFTVEDFNSVLLSCKVNGFHSISTDAMSTGDYRIVDMVKVKRVSGGYEFRVVDGSWSGGFYLTDGDGDYLSLSSSAYSYSDSVLSVDTLESDVVLVLYCSSFFDEFRLEYLNCTLDSLTSVVNAVEVYADDFTSLNGTPVSDGDISVTGESIVCRGNHFYRGVVTVPTPIQWGSFESGFYAGSPKAAFLLTGYKRSMGDIIIEYEDTKRIIPPTETYANITHYEIKDIDLSEYRYGDKFHYQVTYNHTTYKLTENVLPYNVSSVEELTEAIELKVKDIQFINLYLTDDVTVNTPTTFTGYLYFEGGSLIIADNTNVNFNRADFNGGGTGGVVLGENTKTRFTQCDFTELGSTSIKGNEDINNTDSSLLIENCNFTGCHVPMVVYDGGLRIIDSNVSDPNFSGSSRYEPFFVHMTGGTLTITNTSIDLLRVGTLKGYQLCSLLLSEDTVFNGVNALEVSRGNPSLTQYSITQPIDVYYENGDEVIYFDSGFFVAVEEKKIRNIQEEED